MHRLKFVASIVAASLMVAAVPAKSASILFAHVDQTAPYVPNGQSLISFLTADGHTVTERFLNQATYTDYASFDQVWVYDLYTGLNNNANQLANYTNIANWYNNLASSGQNLIADGRIISSTAPQWVDEPLWIQAYANSLDLRGGGLVLGTDHNAYIDGINNINAQINIDLFVGNAPTQEAIVDQASPLFVENGGVAGVGGVDTHACGNAGDLCIWDFSSPSYAPAGLQPNGQTLTPVAYHNFGNAFNDAAVSSTMGSITFGTCGGPNQPPCIFTTMPEPGTLAILGLGLAGLGFARRRKAA